MAGKKKALIMKAASEKANKQNESRAAASAIFQKKSDQKGAMGFVYNRTRSAAGRLTSAPNGLARSSKFIRLYAPSPVPSVVQLVISRLDIAYLVSETPPRKKDKDLQSYCNRIKRLLLMKPKVKELTKTHIRWINEEAKKQYFSLKKKKKKKEKEKIDMSDEKNWPTEKVGMFEEDAAIIAKKYGWEIVKKVDKLTCSDKKHTPKGKVYKYKNEFYGADKDGHVGWGFKVWTRKKGNELQYHGNKVWDGEDWKFIPRV